MSDLVDHASISCQTFTDKAAITGGTLRTVSCSASCFLYPRTAPVVTLVNRESKRKTREAFKAAIGIRKCTLELVRVSIARCNAGYIRLHKNLRKRCCNGKWFFLGTRALHSTVEPNVKITFKITASRDIEVKIFQINVTINKISYLL